MTVHSDLFVHFNPFFMFFISYSSDKFGWSNRIKVAAQLANLLAWLHEKGIAVGCVTASCIMIDEVEFQPLVVWPTFYFS